MTKHFNDGNFNQEVIEASRIKPVLVDFFAVWCGPCKMMAPIIDELAKDMDEKAVIGKLDTEEAQVVAAKYGIMSIPTIMIFRNGEVRETMVGLQSKDSLSAAVERNI